jgi:PAS domain S-box-containing protein
MTWTFFQLSLGPLQNAALLALGVLLYGWLRGPLSRAPSSRRALAEGLYCGGLAVLCMSDPLWFTTGVQIDARNALIAVATFFGGAAAGLVSAIIGCVFRLWIGGAGAQGGAISIILAYGLTLALHHYLHRRAVPAGYRHAVWLALMIGPAMLVPLLGQPLALVKNVLSEGGPAVAIVHALTFVFVAIVLRFERVRAVERTLAESEARLRAIVDNLPDPLSIRDREHRVLLVNKAFERVSRRSAREIVGGDMKALWERMDKGQVLADHARAVWRDGQPVQTQPLRIAYEGHQGSFVVTLFPILNPEGGFDTIGSLASDVTQLLEAQEKLEKREATLVRHQQALIEVVRANALADRRFSFVEAVRALTEAAGEAMEVEYTAVFENDPQHGVARCIDDWSRTTRSHTRTPEAYFAGFRDLLEDLRRQRVIAIADVHADDRMAARRDFLRARNVRSTLLAAIYLGDVLQGCLVFTATEPVRQWTAEDLAFARSIADLIGLMVLTSRLQETLAALDLVNDAIYVERDDGRVIYANGPALALAGLGDASAITPGAAAAFPRPAERLAGERDTHEIAWAHAGAIRDLEIRRSRLPDGGVVTVIGDVTAKKAELRDRERLQLHLQQASKMEAIGQLAGGIAHDFNNLLGAVMGFARFLEHDLPAQSEQHQYAQRILSACNRGKDLVAQILSFTKARTLEREPVDLRMVLAEARELLTASLPPTTRLAVATAGPPVVVNANEAQLQQVVVNLCLNAHDSLGGAPGQIRVALSRPRPGGPEFARPMLFGALDRTRAYARLDVIDNGSGIAAEHLSRIFEPFFTTKERGRGTGLGLAVVHGIVSSYDGACNVESRQGGGTCFSIYLPLADQAVSTRARGERGTNPRGSERILVVDDEIDITDVLSIGLERLGYEVAAVNDPAEALAVFIEDAAFDVVVTDQLMPLMQGSELAETLKSRNPKLIVILCTGLDDGIVDRTAKTCGADAFFAKPVEPEQIAAAIRDLAEK